jgi:hypothetical protein
MAYFQHSDISPLKKLVLTIDDCDSGVTEDDAVFDTPRRVLPIQS